MNPIETIRKSIEHHRLLPDGMDVVAAVSGGVDSVALVHALHSLGTRCTVAHVNHRLRGSESDADERFVENLANELGFPFVCKRVDVRKLASETGQSIEMAARQVRHSFFSEFGDAVVALAHHADDQVETFLLRLARGAGTEGLVGMSHMQQIGGLRLVRPMLDLRRSDIIAWLRENAYEWREDASNTDETILRNRIRHTVLPMLERELNPNLRNTILRSMEILRDESNWMNDAIADCRLPTAELPIALQRRALRKWLFENGVPEVGFDAVEQILALMARGEGTTVYELNDRQRIVVEYGTPRFEQCDFPQTSPSWIVSMEKGFGWRKDHGKGVGILPAEASFSAEKIGDAPIEVRSWQEGDRIAPLGMEGSRKLQDILTDQKVPLANRKHVPVVVCRGEIIWLPGYRIARDWRVESSHGQSVHLRVERIATE